jgi:hypothetical protein
MCTFFILEPTNCNKIPTTDGKRAKITFKVDKGTFDKPNEWHKSKIIYADREIGAARIFYEPIDTISVVQ